MHANIVLYFYLSCYNNIVRLSMFIHGVSSSDLDEHIIVGAHHCDKNIKLIVSALVLHY